MALFVTFWAYAFYHEGNGVGEEAFWQLYRRNSHIFKAIGLLALFAIEVQVPMRMMVIAFVMT